MSDRTKLILAVTLGSVGLALGILGTVVAFNARSEAKSNQEITAVVEEQFLDAQKRQDKLEAGRVSKAEKLVANLSADEKSLLRRLNGNVQAIRVMRKRLNSQKQQIQGLKFNDQQLSGQLTDTQGEIQRDFRQLDQRVDRLNQRINRLQTGSATP